MVLNISKQRINSVANPNNLIKHQYPKGKSGNINGRPKNIEKVLKEFFFAEHNIKLSSSQVNEIYRVLLSKTKAELIDMSKNNDLPFWIALIINTININFKKGSMDVLDKLLDRVYGKAKETAHVTNDGRIEVVFVQGKTIL